METIICIDSFSASIINTTIIWHLANMWFVIKQDSWMVLLNNAIHDWKNQDWRSHFIIVISAKCWVLVYSAICSHFLCKPPRRSVFPPDIWSQPHCVSVNLMSVVICCSCVHHCSWLFIQQWMCICVCIYMKQIKCHLKCIVCWPDCALCLTFFIQVSPFYSHRNLHWTSFINMICMWTVYRRLLPSSFLLPLRATAHLPWP